MFLSWIATALLISECVPLATVAGQDQDPAKSTVNLIGSVADESLQKEVPENGVIVSQKGWEKLVKAWGITDAPKVDFTKELLVVATTRGSRINLTPKLDNGDLKVVAISTRDLRPGFRYVIKSVSREGVKTINGKELPKE